LVPDIESTVYRLVQESLTNIAKHARAERVDVQLGETDDWVTVLVRDDGQGFDTAAKSEGFGLLGMRERVNLVGGDLDIESVPGEGTAIHARMPAEHLPKATQARVAS
jgi:signal transduction histidine kinase